MTIDFQHDRIYHFDKDLNRKEHQPISTSFKEIEILDNGNILVIEDYNMYENAGRSNLYCLNRELDIEWFLPYPYENPTSMDNYVGFTTNGDRIFANTFSCYRVEIDVDKGLLLNISFTK